MKWQTEEKLVLTGLFIFWFILWILFAIASHQD